jgi:hypothetical protein
MNWWALADSPSLQSPIRRGGGSRRGPPPPPARSVAAARRVLLDQTGARSSDGAAAAACQGRRATGVRRRHVALSSLPARNSARSQPASQQMFVQTFAVLH